MMVGHSYLSAAWTRACVQYLFISPRTDGAGQGKGAGSDGRGFERGLSCPQPRQSSTVPCGVFGGGAVGGGKRDLRVGVRKTLRRYIHVTDVYFCNISLSSNRSYRCYCCAIEKSK